MHQTFSYLKLFALCLRSQAPLFCSSLPSTSSKCNNFLDYTKVLLLEDLIMAYAQPLPMLTLYIQQRSQSFQINKAFVG